MPYYDYKCPHCGFTMIGKAPIEMCNMTTCPNCGHLFKIIIHPVPFIFKEKP